MGMALSPDGKRLATSDGTTGLQLWDVDSGAWIRDMQKTTGQISAPTFSAEGLLVASLELTADGASPDGFSIWEVASGRRLARLPMGRGFQSLSGAFLPGGLFIASGHSDKPAPPSLTRLWNLAAGPGRPRLVDQFERFTDWDPAWAELRSISMENDSSIVLRETCGRASRRESCVSSPRPRISRHGPAPPACHVRRRRDRAGAEAEYVGRANGQTARQTCRAERVAALVLQPRLREAGGHRSQRGHVHLIDRAYWRDSTRSPREMSLVTPYTRIAFSPDSTGSRPLLSGLSKGGAPDPVSIWETATGRHLASFPGRSESVGKPGISRQMVDRC